MIAEGVYNPTTGETVVIQGVGYKYLECESTDEIDSIISHGVHFLSFDKLSSSTYPYAEHKILIVDYYKGPNEHIGSAKYIIYQTKIDLSGVCTRYRAFNDDEHTDPYTSWSEWEYTGSTDNITSGNTHPIRSWAVYDALGYKMDAAHEVKINIDPVSGACGFASASDASSFLPSTMSGDDPVFNVVVEFTGAKNYKAFGSCYVSITLEGQSISSVDIRLYVDGYVFSLNEMPSVSSVFDVEKNTFDETN